MKLNRQKIEYYMAQKQKCINDICQESGVSRQTFRMGVTGKCTSRPSTVGRIAASLGVEVSDIVDLDDEETNKK